MAGRPLKFESLESLKDDIDSFFSECDADEDPYTITGLALALGTCRQTLLNYEERDEFLDTIKQAKLKCENYAEKRLFKDGKPTGAIFALKNYGWVDRSEHDLLVAGDQDRPLKWEIEVTHVDAKKKAVSGG